jgi:AsmA protein
MLPDPQSRIERSGAAAPLLDAVRNRGSRDAVRSVIERLTGAAPSRSAPAAETAAENGGSSAETAPSADAAPAHAEPSMEKPTGSP